MTVRTPAGLPAGVRQLGLDTGLPALPQAPRRLCLHDGSRPLSPAGVRLAALIGETFRDGPFA